LDPSLTLNTVQDLSNAIVKVGVVNGSVYADTTYTGISGATFVYYSSINAALQDVANNVTHVAIWDQPLCVAFVQTTCPQYCSFIVNPASPVEQIGLFVNFTSPYNSGSSSSSSSTGSSTNEGYNLIFLFILLKKINLL